MKPLKIYLCDLTYDSISLATDAFPLNIGFVAAYCKNKFKERVSRERERKARADTRRAMEKKELEAKRIKSINRIGMSYGLLLMPS